MRLYRAVRPLLFSLPAETAHENVLRLLRLGQGTPLESLIASRYVVDDPRLEVAAFGQTFPTPVGIAAGFDKNGHVPSMLASLGFGHVELGGITAEAQPGNPRPRMFRLREDEAIINRMGFNNDGADRVGRRLAATTLPDVPVGINIGKSKATPVAEAAEDYAYTYDQLAAYGDFFVVNVSSPNTPGLRELQDREPLRRIIGELQDRGATPLLVKLSPDLSREAIIDAVDLATGLDIDGLIATNTTTGRPDTLRSQNGEESGGLSGKPLEERSTHTVRLVASRTDLPVIGVGGVFTARDAYRKIRVGASLVQLYTGLIYRGPAIARDIHVGLLDLLDRDGFDSIEEAIGADL